jgi:hypothetical protein
VPGVNVAYAQDDAVELDMNVFDPHTAVDVDGQPVVSGPPPKEEKEEVPKEKPVSNSATSA